MEEVKKRNRLEKSKKYVKERGILIGKLDEIIGLDENNNRVIIADTYGAPQEHGVHLW